MADGDVEDEETRRNRALDSLGQLIDGIVAQACLRHYDAETQEHQLTAKIADAIEREVGGSKIDGYTVGIAVQDMPDRGKGSEESITGADLYISVVLQSDEDEEPVSKGMLVQAKWDDTLSPESADTRRQLRNMLDRSRRASFVWVYSPTGAVSIPANDVLQGETQENATTPGQLIANGLKCTKGDARIGRDTDMPLVRSLNDMLQELSAKKGRSIHRPLTQARFTP
jgi:hypothetical protein